MENTQNIQEQEKLFFKELTEKIASGEFTDKKKINTLKTSLSKKYNVRRIVKNTEIISAATDEQRESIIKVLNVKPVREASGVTIVALFAKPHKCPHGKCIYCPGGIDSEFGDTPQSYTGSEPAAMRAIRNLYDPYMQIFNRLEHYVVNGHMPDKLELIFMGGTFPSLDKEYQDEFAYFTYKAINDFGDLFIFKDENGKKQINYDKFNKFFTIGRGDFQSKERDVSFKKNVLEQKEINVNKNYKESYKVEIKKAETSLIRPIGLTIETKPDYALASHCSAMLEYGCTRFEVGVQVLDNEILYKVNRGHNLLAVKKSFQIMKDMAFKINCHMMLNLPYATTEIDKRSMKDLFENEDYKPDMLKIYPCLVTKGTQLFDMYKSGEYIAKDTIQTAEIIAECFKDYPRWVRVMRVQRDIPTPNIEAGVKKSNLRQYVDKFMIEKNIVSHDIRAREIGLQNPDKKEKIDNNFDIKIQNYKASEGEEYFLDVVNKDDILIGFIRLRLPTIFNLRAEITSGTALIRELHVYGHTTAVGAKGETQHKGWGTKLLAKAEEIAKEKGFKKMAIISGVGVREYYRKFGYVLEGLYMTKEL